MEGNETKTNPEGTETTKKEDVTKETQQKDNETKQGQEGKKVDVEKERKHAVADYLSGLGVDEDTLKNILAKHKEEEEKNKTELQKSEDTVKAATAQLAEERKARLKAEAKSIAMQNGVNPKLVEDFVIVAMAKVTKDKDIEAVVAEMKESESGKLYFGASEEEEEESKTKQGNRGTVTRKRVQKKAGADNNKKKEGGGDEGTESKYEGTMAKRIFDRRAKVGKSSYFKS